MSESEHIDPFPPTQVSYPHFIDWAITRRCNLSCLHCRGMTESELTFDRMVQLVDEIATLHPGWIIIEGGEPLLHPEIYSLLRLIRRKKIPVYLITNGTLLSRERIDVLKQLAVYVMVSIDGAKASTFERIRRGANFEQVMASAIDCAQANILDSLNFTVSKLNYREIPDFFQLASSIGAKRIIFIGLKPCQEYNEQSLSPPEYIEAIKFVCQKMSETDLDVFFDEPFFWPVATQYKLPLKKPLDHSGILAPQTTACIFGEYLFIEPNGDVKPCNFAPLVLGNAGSESLKEIWDKCLSAPLLNQLRSPNTRTGYCRSCAYLEQCRGCRSRTFNLTGDWFATDPLCPIACNKEVTNESSRY